jgi:8-oxo-dGTP diphosphatase
MMIVDFHELDDSVSLKISVIVAKDKSGFVFVKHQNRDTWEIPGGHIEAGETPAEAANRELREETGALSFNISEICNYSVRLDESISYGRLYFAEIRDYTGSLDFEIDKIKSFVNIPDNLTYPQIHPFLFHKVVNSVLDKT